MALKNGITALISSINLLLYIIQGFRLGLESGFTNPLVLSNIIIAALFAGALSLSLLYPRATILTPYTVANSSYITYRMWNSAMDLSRTMEFRLAHGLMITLAWLLVIAILYNLVKRIDSRAPIQAS